MGTSMIIIILLRCYSLSCIILVSDDFEEIKINLYVSSWSMPSPRTPGNISMLDVIEKDRYTIHRPNVFFAELSRYWKIWREKWILWGWIYGYDDYLRFPTIYFGMWMKQMQHKKYNFKIRLLSHSKYTITINIEFLFVVVWEGHRGCFYYNFISIMLFLLSNGPLNVSWKIETIIHAKYVKQKFVHASIDFCRQKSIRNYVDCRAINLFFIIAFAVPGDVYPIATSIERCSSIFLLHRNTSKSLLVSPSIFVCRKVSIIICTIKLLIYLS